jgi:hypothetical protein
MRGAMLRAFSATAQRLTEELDVYAAPQSGNASHRDAPSEIAHD